MCASEATIVKPVFEIADYQHYLDLLSIMLKRYQVSLHAYVLMTNHVHLLMTAEDIPHEVYLDLSADREERLICYRGLFKEVLRDNEVEAI